MVTLEQVKLLESKAAQAVEFVSRLNSEITQLRSENARLGDENTRLRDKLEPALKKISDLEGMIQQFKEDQGKIEAGVIAALDRLNQFEDVIGKTLTIAQGRPAEEQRPQGERRSGGGIHTLEPRPPAPREEPSVDAEEESPEEEVSEEEGPGLDIF